MMPYYWCPFISKSAERMNVYQQQGQMIPGQVMPGQMVPGQMPPTQLPAGQIQPGTMYPSFMQPIPQLYQGQGIHMLPGAGMMGAYDMDNMFDMYDYMDDFIDMDDMDDVEAKGVTSDPPPILSDNPAITSVVLFKELTGYPNYGNPSGNADILYTGNRGVWTFQIPAYLFVPGALRAQLAIRAVLDDHSTVPVDRYSARITINGTQVHTGRVPLEHGRPPGGRFTNWSLLTFNVSNLRRSNRIVIVNTSNTGDNDWIGLDWMEMRLNPTR